MSTYEDDHAIPQPSANNSSGTSDNSPYAARPAPRTFAEFLAEVNRITDLTHPEDAGRSEPDSGGIMIDEDLYEEIFSGESAIGRNAFGASEEAIDGLKRVTEHDLLASFKGTLETPHTSSCPICLLTLDQILTEQEYAEASDHFIGDEKELGLRRLPCRGTDGAPTGGTVGGAESTVGGGHVICGKCARKWLRMNNTCPMCRSVVDPSLPTASEDPNSAATYNNQMLSLFRATFGQGAELRSGSNRTGDGQTSGIPQAGMPDVMNDHMTGLFGMRGGPFGATKQRRESDEAPSGMYM